VVLSLVLALIEFAEEPAEAEETSPSAAL